MTSRPGDLLDDLERVISAHGVEVRLKQMDLEKPGVFDGPSITINPVHDRDAASYYLAHSFGSIYQWSTDFEHAQQVFDELRDAKRGRVQFSESADENCPRPLFEEALSAWRRFEQTSSEHAVWVLDHAGHADAIAPYTVFFRADIEAMTVFHRTGKEPRWPDFFADWKEKVSRGEIRVEPFQPRPVAPFSPVRIKKQEVLQERD
jgi:hypothetical protein